MENSPRGTGGSEPESPRPTASGTGLERNVAAALCYLIGLITGVLFLVLEQDRPFVQYHAYQSIALSVAWIALWIVGAILGVIPIVGWLLGVLLGLVLTIGGLILWLYLMWQAYQGNEPELPWVGPWAREQVGGGVGV